MLLIIIHNVPTIVTGFINHAEPKQNNPLFVLLQSSFIRNRIQCTLYLFKIYLLWEFSITSASNKMLKSFKLLKNERGKWLSVVSFEAIVQLYIPHLSQILMSLLVKILDQRTLDGA